MLLPTSNEHLHFPSPSTSL